MTDDRQEQQRKAGDLNEEVIRKRGFTDAEYAATEREQTRDIEQARREQSRNESDEFVTDAELEAREDRSED